jgi:hypothetical protein
MLGHPGLRLLIALKLKGGVRAQARRLKQPKNWIFLGLGGLLMLAWLASFLGGAMRSSSLPSGHMLFLGTRLGLVVLVLLTLIGAFNHRGLYLPKEEIELCFSAPVSRSDLVRYRLLINLLKSVFAAVIFGLGASMRMPVGIFGFLGACVTLLTVPIVGQITAIVLGGAENKLGKLASKLPLRGMTIALVMVLMFVAVGFVLGQSNPFANLLDPDRTTFEELASSNVVRTLLLPFDPWARMITAQSAREFLPWFAFAIAFWIAGFVLATRIDVDFRELSLATSADIAKRLNRLRRGSFGIGRSKPSKTALGWNAPWILGRGSFGAVAWLKLATIMRAERNTVLVSVFIVLAITLASGMLRPNSPEDVLVGSAILCSLCTVYLCLGLRFDFRSDLEIMDAIKSWPLQPWALFLATLLPEVLLVSALIAFLLVGRVAILHYFHPGMIALLAFQPLVTFTWVALDNAVFLYSPVRHTPGDEGALQHMGRSMVLMLLRLALVGVVVVAAGVPATASWLLVTYVLGGSTELGLSIASAVGWLGLAAVDFGLVMAGGMVLRRFDVARDKPQ